MTTPAQAVARAAPGRSVIGWKLEPAQRRELLERFPPKFGETVADHVTLKAKVAPDAALPDAADGEIVGCADDGDGVECMVVSIAGSTARPGGGTYHITWSLAPGRQARESNDVLAKHGWAELDTPLPVTLIPARLR